LPRKPLASALSGTSRMPLAAIILPTPPMSADTPSTVTPSFGFSPARSTSAAALPSGNAICWSTISERRSGTENNTPNNPPRPAIAHTHQYLKSGQ
jgi:hypothetical protein